MPDCLFCSIIAGTIPSEKIFEDGVAYAFLDIHPVNKGHVLVIPKVHAENIYTMTKQDFGALMERVHMLAPQVKAATGAEGINIIMNNDPVAGQVIFHAHIHILPRFHNDGFHHWRGEGYKDDELAEFGDTLRKQVKK